MSSQRSDWRERLNVNPSRMEQELALKLQDNGISFQTQVEIPVTVADFYFATESKPLIVFVDGPVHLKTTQAMKDEELRTLLRKRGYRILELTYDGYSDRRRDQLYEEIVIKLGKYSEKTDLATPGIRNLLRASRIGWIGLGTVFSRRMKSSFYERR